ncbi:MAG: glycoside hydrolase family 130 protein [Planctomycetota bacterium]
MSDYAVAINRLPIKFDSDDKRVITRFFGAGGDPRVKNVVERVASLNDREISDLLADTMRRFDHRHRDLQGAFLRNFDQVRHNIDNPDGLTADRRLLLGAYFTMEYAIEAAALFNPSMVEHPDQSSAPKGGVRFIMSLRATGEGHVSSIVFRAGSVSASGEVVFDEPSPYSGRLRIQQDKTYDKHLFFLKLIEMAAYSDACRVVLDALPERFTLPDLERTLDQIAGRNHRPDAFDETANNMRWLARSNYTLDVPEGAPASEIVIFPTSENESRGIEDLRLTRFVGDDGAVKYYGTYTAYNGFVALPQILETENFQHVEIHTLNGKYVQNKGMALFPRKIDGDYVIAGRIDGENNFLLRSDNVHFWNNAVKLQGPVYPWEFVQIGNCGAPIETPEGWLLLTHGVGPMRRYCIGVTLLDLDDPSKVIAHSPTPILAPNSEERDGYVPNVVYSCGAIKHNDLIVMPYAMSDSASSVCTFSCSELLAYLKKHAPASSSAAKASAPARSAAVATG